MVTSKPPTRIRPPILPTSKPRTSPAVAHTPKKFAAAKWSDEGEGEKIVIYGKSGIGKTTLASMVPKPIFLGIDLGGRKIHNPKTEAVLDHIPGIDTFQDLRDVVQQPGVFKGFESVVLDTITKVDSLASEHVVDTIKQGGKSVSTFRHFGWDGDRHLLDQFRLLLSDLDNLVSQGLNVILVAQLGQITVANSGGVDFLEDGPKLQHRRDCSVRTEVTEWADHVCRIGYQDFATAKEDPKARAGKVISDDATRAIYTGGAQHFVAKSRPVTANRENPVRIPIGISFAHEADDSLWQYLFLGAEIPTE